MKQYVLLCLAILLATGGCSKSTDPSGNTVPFSEVVNQYLPGTWDNAGETGKIYITTKTNQEINDNSRPCTGNITVTGDVSATMNYLTYYNIEGEIILVVSNQYIPFFEEVTNLTYPLYVLVAEYIDGQWETVMFMAATTRDLGVMYTASSVPYTYNETTRTLTISSFTLTDYQGGGTVTLNGSLTYQTTAIYAGQRYLLMEWEDDPTGEVMEFDSTGVYRYTGWGGRTEQGTWALAGSQLVLTTTEVETLTFNLTGNTLIFTITEDMADEYGPGAELDSLYRDYERTLGIAEGSLASAEAVQTITYNKRLTATKVLATADRPKTVPNALLSRFLPAGK